MDVASQCFVVEMSTLVVGGARHATRDDGRCVGHSRRQRSFVRRLVQGAHRRAVRVSSLQLSYLLVADDHPRRREQTCRYAQGVEYHLLHDLFSTLLASFVFPGFQTTRIYNKQVRSCTFIPPSANRAEMRSFG